MEYLLDTHTLLWFMNGDETIPESIVETIKNKNNICFISIASLWEIAIKISIGKLTLNFPFQNIVPFLVDNNIEILSINVEHLQILTTLEYVHRDPFDRIIIVQAIHRQLTILTKDMNFRNYPTLCLW